MRTAFGILVIWVVIVAIYLSLAVAGVIGATAAGLVTRAGDSEQARSSRWVGVAAVTGVVSGQAAALVALVGAALVGWSLAGFVLTPICWSVAAVSAAVVRLAPLKRRRGSPRDGTVDRSAVRPD